MFFIRQVFTLNKHIIRRIIYLQPIDFNQLYLWSPSALLMSFFKDGMRVS